MKRSTLCTKIAATGGIGPIAATALVATVGEAEEFRNGRHLVVGLAP
jgi:transposase